MPYRKRSSQSGQTLVLVGFLLLAIMTLGALGADFGIFVFNWGQIRRSADAAVLAGANSLNPGSPVVSVTCVCGGIIASCDGGATSDCSDPAVAIADGYALMNGIQCSEITCAGPNADRTQLKMTITRNVDYSFGRVVGLTTAPVSVTAVAQLDYISYLNCPDPVAVNKDYYVANQPSGPGSPGNVVTLRAGGGGGGTYVSGNWAALNFAGGGAAAYESELKQQSCPPGLQIGASVSVTTEPGKMVGPTDKAINYLLTQGLDPKWIGCSAIKPCAGDPQLMQMIVVDAFTGGGATSWTVSTLQPFWLEASAGGGAFTGQFVVAPEGGSPGTSKCLGRTTSNGGCAPLLVQ